jgi:hypothetical protein
MGIKIGILSVVFAIVGMTGDAQAQDAGTTPASSGGGASSSAAATAANPNAKNAATTGTSQTPAAAEKKKPKKVWTNEEIGSVGGTISVVGDPNKTESASTVQKETHESGADDLKTKQIEAYRDQVRQLKGQIDEADKRIAQLKNFKGENNSAAGGINPNQGYNMVPVEEQVKQLEEKKKQTQNKIEDVENDARKNGIESGDLR